MYRGHLGFYLAILFIFSAGMLLILRAGKGMDSGMAAAGSVFRMLGKPRVVGEMAAGIFLGPSVLVCLSPGIHEFLFRPGTLARWTSLARSAF